MTRVASQTLKSAEIHKLLSQPTSFVNIHNDVLPGLWAYKAWVTTLSPLIFSIIIIIIIIIITLIIY